MSRRFMGKAGAGDRNRGIISAGWETEAVGVGGEAPSREERVRQEGAGTQPWETSYLRDEQRKT